MFINHSWITNKYIANICHIWLRHGCWLYIKYSITISQLVVRKVLDCSDLFFCDHLSCTAVLCVDMVPFANSSYQQLVAVNEGQAAIIDLPPIDCHPEPTIQWRNILTGIRITGSSQQYHLTLDKQLVILSTRVNRDNGFIFRAEAQNIYTLDRSNSGTFLISVNGACHFFGHRCDVTGNMKTDRHLFNGLFFRTAWVSRHQKG